MPLSRYLQLTLTGPILLLAIIIRLRRKNMQKKTMGELSRIEVSSLACGDLIINKYLEVITSAPLENLFGQHP